MYPGNYNNFPQVYNQKICPQYPQTNSQFQQTSQQYIQPYQQQYMQTNQQLYNSYNQQYSLAQQFTQANQMPYNQYNQQSYNQMNQQSYNQMNQQSYNQMNQQSYNQMNQQLYRQSTQQPYVRPYNQNSQYQQGTQQQYVQQLYIQNGQQLYPQTNQQYMQNYQQNNYSNQNYYSTQPQYSQQYNSQYYGQTQQIVHPTQPAGQIQQMNYMQYNPKYSVVFNPSQYSESYNPWSASMWLHEFQPDEGFTEVDAIAVDEQEQPSNEQHSNNTSSDDEESSSHHSTSTISNTQELSKPTETYNQQEPHQLSQLAKPSEPVQLGKPAKPQEPSKQSQSVKSQASQSHQLSKTNNSKQTSNLSSQNPPGSKFIFQFDSIQQFQKLRHHTTESSALSQLRELAMELTNIDASQFSPDETSCLILCNSYTKPKYKLGVGPINDAITVAANHKYMGYKVYFLHDPQRKVFLSFLKVFLEKASKYFSFYYSGHGSQVRDTNGDEDDGFDEVMVFDEGYVIDDELAEYLNKYSKGTAHTVLMADCCHSGTIWDIPTKPKAAKKFPANIISISSSEDSQTAKQKKFEEINQGVFTYHFWTLIRNNPLITPRNVEKILNSEIGQFRQKIVVCPTRQEMLDLPIFPLMKRH